MPAIEVFLGRPGNSMGRMSTDGTEKIFTGPIALSGPMAIWNRSHEPVTGGGHYSDGTHTEWASHDIDKCYTCDGLGVLSLTGKIRILR